MMAIKNTIRKNYSKELKLKVVFEVLRGEKSLVQISSEYSVHVSQIKEWRAQAIEAMSERFRQFRGRKKSNLVDESKLFEEIGRLKVELDFIKGKLAN